MARRTRPTRLGPPRRLQFETGDYENLTHYIFRYPAKFHPPVARSLIEQFSKKEQTILDPFCGSGTLLVEAAALKRHGAGVDIDPLAVFVSRVKTAKWPHHKLRAAAARLLDRLEELRRPHAEYVRRQWEDVPRTRLLATIADEGLWTPPIPNLLHWFRRYVIVDLARILATINGRGGHARYRDFFRLCFASIIRASSNADPVPVSGLEVTSHMIQRDEEGRLVDPFELFRRAIENSLDAIEEYSGARIPGVVLTVQHGDSTRLAFTVRRQVDAIITSPPYHGAVDYYRRHMLEMFWLGLTRSTDDRLALLPKYVGRSVVPRSHPFLAQAPSTRRVMHWEARMRQEDPVRADSFRHYVVAMQRFFQGAATVLPVKKKAVLVVGRSSWNGMEIPTSQLLTELAHEHFDLVEHSWYPIKNRYMSYQRHNGADIDREHVLVYQRRNG